MKLHTITPSLNQGRFVAYRIESEQAQVAGNDRIRKFIPAQKGSIRMK